MEGTYDMPYKNPYFFVPKYDGVEKALNFENDIASLK